MGPKGRGFVMIAAGGLLAAVSIVADEIGIGEGTGVGWRQVLGTLVGLAVAAVGAYRARQAGD